MTTPRELAESVLSCNSGVTNETSLRLARTLLESEDALHNERIRVRERDERIERQRLDLKKLNDSVRARAANAKPFDLPADDDPIMAGSLRAYDGDLLAICCALLFGGRLSESLARRICEERERLRQRLEAHESLVSDLRVMAGLDTVFLERRRVVEALADLDARIAGQPAAGDGERVFKKSGADA